ncbi:hypothetical protein [Qipengyuania gaetbuli]|uniref:hypothetical protein n=1 Tax=Qipengyuania gaetbuli TaxID=266952 RepID=UPI001CFE1629|nr:hypothetical protein [Qipengyuania gaetbuli]
MALPIALPAILGIGAWASRLLGAVKLSAVLFAIIKLYWLFSLLAMAFWIAITYFAKEIFTWICEVVLSLVDIVLSATMSENPGPKIVELVSQLPPFILDLWARLGLWTGLSAVLAAYSANMALRCIPFVGGIFRG